MTIDLLFNREILLVSKHNKEQVLAPLFLKHFNCTIVKSTKFDTDSLGSFSGEVKREKSAIETVIAKANLGLKSEEKEYDLVLSSEGSFGSHPEAFFLTSSEEFLYLKDLKNNFEIIVKHFTTNVNFAEIESESLTEILNFAREVGFPEQGIIVKSGTQILKEVESFEELESKLNLLLKESTTVQIETDLRAHRNPTRMAEIGLAGEKLIKDFKSTCPKCKTPGFQITRAENGLPCELCDAPTKSILKVISCCKICQHESEKYYPNSKQKEEAQFCDFCNP
jgi:hypothetical protein